MIAEIETDKATMEVEAVDEGVIAEILVPEGSAGVKVNTPIARLKNGDAGAAPSPQPAPKAERRRRAHRSKSAHADRAMDRKSRPP